MLIDIFQQWLNIPQNKLEIIREIINSLHTSSLMYELSYSSLTRVGSTILKTILNSAEVFQVGRVFFWQYDNQWHMRYLESRLQSTLPTMCTS